MTENEIAKIIVDRCFHIHKKLGPGLFESVYEEVLCYELRKLNLNYERQKLVEIEYDELVMDKGFIADIIVEKKVIIELKAVKQIEPVHQKQLVTYLKLTDMKLGLLINFDVPLIKNGIQRIVNNL
ncbi:MAG: GxxExxY protein [Bacteroidetes bacterium]|nr:GxxExxY protein [Bacteroidota bacterium]MBP6314609.1 GxxExxY protein [Chitinophagaceae bacterium]